MNLLNLSLLLQNVNDAVGNSKTIIYLSPQAQPSFIQKKKKKMLIFIKTFLNILIKSNKNILSLKCGLSN